jgi:uncharacterized membrane protein
MTYYAISIVIVIIAFIPFILSFERRKPKARELVVIAVLVALGVIGRAAFFMLPQCKPVVAIVIIIGISLGAQSGFLSGALIAFISNFIFGQGPWTIYQMLALGLIGLIAGLIFHKNGRDGSAPKVAVCILGFFSALIVYGVLLDAASVIMFTGALGGPELITAITLGLPFNLILAASTVVFLLLLFRPITDKLDRIKLKYNMY